MTKKVRKKDDWGKEREREREREGEEKVLEGGRTLFDRLMASAKVHRAADIRLMCGSRYSHHLHHPPSYPVHTFFLR